MKVFSHQLTEDFQVATEGEIPQPNMLIASTNQFVDNAATQSRSLSMTTHTNDYDKAFYSPFSPKWCFSFEGGLASKGVTKDLQEKLDIEFILQQQHRSKQGLLFRILPFVSHNAQQLADEFLLCNIFKMDPTLDPMHL